MRDIVLKNIKITRQLLEEYENSCVDTVLKITELILDCFKSGGKVYLCGNGGSACDAQHIAGELVGHFLKDRKALPAISLNSDGGMLTCISNDFDFSHVFSKQLEGLAKPGDILWAFSCSGTSPNILNALDKAKEIGLKTIGFTGKTQTPMENICDITLCVKAPYAAHAQQIHQIAYHTICEIVEEQLFPCE